MAVSNEMSLLSCLSTICKYESNTMENLTVGRVLNDRNPILKDKIDAHPLDILVYIDLIKYYECIGVFKKGQDIYSQLYQKFPLYSPI